MESILGKDEIFVCAGCGKLPKLSEHSSEGTFSCSRCGQVQKLSVSSDDYSQTTQNLESNFFKNILEKRLASVDRIIIASELSLPIPLATSTKKKKTSKKKSSKKSYSRLSKPKSSKTKKSNQSSKSKSRRR